MTRSDSAVAGEPSALSNSNPAIKPTPRGRQVTLDFGPWTLDSLVSNHAPSFALRSQSFSRLISAICANAIAQPTGWPRYVLVWIASPCDGGHAASITSARPTQAESGKPPVNALPRQVRSGITPLCSQANHFPVRPNPV